MAVPSIWYPNLVGKIHPDAEKAITYILQNLQGLNSVAKTVNNVTNQNSIGFETNTTNVANQTNNTTNVTAPASTSIQGAIGTTADSQNAKATLVTSLPTASSPLAQLGTLIQFNNTIYSWTSSGWQEAGSGGPWTAWTSTVDSSQAVTTQVGTFFQFGNSVWMRLYVLSTVAAGNTLLTFSLPVGPIQTFPVNYAQTFGITGFINGSLAVMGCRVNSSTQLIEVSSITFPSGVPTNGFPIGCTVELNIQGIYEAS